MVLVEVVRGEEVDVDVSVLCVGRESWMLLPLLHPWAGTGNGGRGLERVQRLELPLSDGCHIGYRLSCHGCLAAGR